MLRGGVRRPGRRPLDPLLRDFDRFANNGTAQIGSWFFQDEVSLNATTFSGIHTEGDVLVLSDFTQGGSISTIRVLKWVDSPGVCNPPVGDPDPNCEDANLLRIGQGVDCAVTTAPDDVCASVNRGVVDAPWPYSAKFSAPPNAGTGRELLRGRHRRHPADSGRPCFTSFRRRAGPRRRWTRCSRIRARIVPAVRRGDQHGAGARRRDRDWRVDQRPGNGHRDRANAPPPTGTVDFVCGPLAAGAVCDTGGTLVSTEDLDGVNNPSIVTSDLFTPNEAGRWCFRGEYSGDDNYDEAVDFDESECFTVNPAGSRDRDQRDGRPCGHRKPDRRHGDAERNRSRSGRLGG